MKEASFSGDIKKINQFFSSLIKVLQIDKKKAMNEALIENIALLLDEQKKIVKKDYNKAIIRLMGKIKDSAGLLNESFTEATENNKVVEAEILYWKQKLKLLGLAAHSNTPMLDQVQQLLRTTQKRDVKGMSESFRILAQHFASQDSGNINKALEDLKKQLPSPQYEAIARVLNNNNNSNNISQTLTRISERLQQEEDAINLDEVVHILETNFDGLLKQGKEEKAAAKKEEYDESARNSIRKSLMAKGIKPLN